MQSDLPIGHMGSSEGCYWLSFREGRLHLKATRDPVRLIPELQSDGSGQIHLPSGVDHGSGLCGEVHPVGPDPDRTDGQHLADRGLQRGNAGAEQAVVSDVVGHWWTEEHETKLAVLPGRVQGVGVRGGQHRRGSHARGAESFEEHPERREAAGSSSDGSGQQEGSAQQHDHTGGVQQVEPEQFHRQSVGDPGLQRHPGAGAATGLPDGQQTDQEELRGNPHLQTETPLTSGFYLYRLIKVLVMIQL